MLGSLPTFARLEAELGKLPGIGRKTAARLAFHLLRTSEQDVTALADALVEMKRKVCFCRRCFHVAEGELCQLCADSAREGQSLCIVQEPQDLLAIERSRAYRGLYHVLHGALSPLDGIGRTISKFRNCLTVWSRNRLKRSFWRLTLPSKERRLRFIWLRYVKKED